MSRAVVFVMRSRAERDKLIEDHLHLVGPIARRLAQYLPACFEVDDLISCGMIGLTKAAERYNPRANNNTPFPAYAKTCIRGAMQESYRRRNWRDSVNDSLQEALTSEEESGGESPRLEGKLATLDPSDENIDRRRAAREVRAAIARLPARQKRVIEIKYMAEGKLAIAGKAIGVGSKRATQIHGESLAALRRDLEIHGRRAA